MAIIGCGAVAHLQRLRIYPRVAHLGRVVATCDPVPERAADLAAALQPAPGQAAAQAGQEHVPGPPTPEIRVYADLAHVLADPRVQAVDVCTPHPTHAALAIQAARAGRHVLVEKPLATTLADGRRMIDAARDARVVLAVNEQLHFLAPLRRARDLIVSGALGALATVRAHRIGYLGGAYLDSGWRRDAALAGGGMLLDQGPHYFHALRLLAAPVAGEITHVAALATTVRDDWSPGAEDTAVVLVRYEAGLLGEALFCWATRTPAVGAWVYAYGTDGSLEVFSRKAGLIWHRARGGPQPTRGPGAQATPKPTGQTGEAPETVMPSASIDDALVATLADFLGAASGAHPPSMSGEEGLHDLAVVEAAYRSLRSTRLERVERV